MPFIKQGIYFTANYNHNLGLNVKLQTHVFSSSEIIAANFFGVLYHQKYPLNVIGIDLQIVSNPPFLINNLAFDSKLKRRNKW